MPKILTRLRVKKTVYLDEDLYEYFLGVNYSPTKGVVEKKFSDLINELLRLEQDRQVASAKERNAAKAAEDASL